MTRASAGPRVSAARLSRFLVGAHPRRWRKRYAAELLDVLDQHRPTRRTVLNMGVSAVSAHFDPAWASWWPGRAGLRRLGHVGIGVGAFALISGLVVSCAAWQDYEGNNGPPMPLSDGTFGMAFSPDGRMVAAINPSLEIWSVADPARPRRLGYSKGDTAGAPAAFAPSGRVLATAGWPGMLWDVTHPTPRPRQIAVLPHYPADVNALLFSPDGRTLVSGDALGALTLWNTASPAHVSRIAAVSGAGSTVTDAGHPTGVTALACSPDGHVLATGDSSGGVSLWNAADPGRVTRVAAITGAPDIADAGTAHDSSTSALAFAPDGHLLASASQDGTVTLRDVTNPAAPVVTATARVAIPPVRANLDQLTSDVKLAFSADGHVLTTIAGNDAVTRWGVTSAGAVTWLGTLASGSIGSGAVAFAPGGQAVAGSPTTGDTLILWTLPSRP